MGFDRWHKVCFLSKPPNVEHILFSWLSALKDTWQHDKVLWILADTIERNFRKPRKSNKGRTFCLFFLKRNSKERRDRRRVWKAVVYWEQQPIDTCWYIWSRSYISGRRLQPQTWHRHLVSLNKTSNYTETIGAMGRTNRRCQRKKQIKVSRRTCRIERDNGWRN